jgi:hypothetical protein
LENGAIGYVEQLDSGLGDHIIQIYGPDNAYTITGRYDVIASIDSIVRVGCSKYQPKLHERLS